MNLSQVTTKMRFAALFLLLAPLFCDGLKKDYNAYTHDGSLHFMDPEVVYANSRAKREAPALAAGPPVGAAAEAGGPTQVGAPAQVGVPAQVGAPVQLGAPAASSTPGPPNPQAPANATVVISNKTVPQYNVTQTPASSAAPAASAGPADMSNTTKVSEPIFPDDDNFTEIYKPEANVTTLKEDMHEFYNSTFIQNQTYFNEYWANLNKEQSNLHPLLSNSHRRATTLSLPFDFPFYGHGLRTITVATGGFIYTGEHIHNWLAATQYIAPLMANFDTTISNDSYVKLYNDSERFTAFWENVVVQEDASKKFTFAVTLYKTGDIDFAYKDIPIPIANISDRDHPVKVGISDAYLTDKVLFLVRRKTIYEYHRVSFKSYEIGSGSVLRLTALPTCLDYHSCEACANHNTGFDCMWCELIAKCSSGTDRNKQDWVIRNCDSRQINNATQCPNYGSANAAPSGGGNGNTVYTTDTETDPHHTAVINTLNDKPRRTESSLPSEHAPVTDAKITAQSPVGSVVAAVISLTVLFGIAAWGLYAFKNPHTRSGQLLIKYRPSAWRCRRGEARYTAATIHM